jgi:hypothetical protein
MFPLLLYNLTLLIVFLEQLEEYNTNLNFIGYQEKLTPVLYFSHVLHMSLSSAVTVTTDAGFITAVLWYSWESVCDLKVF